MGSDVRNVDGNFRRCLSSCCWCPTRILCIDRLPVPGRTCRERERDTLSPFKCNFWELEMRLLLKNSTTSFLLLPTGRLSSHVADVDVAKKKSRKKVSQETNYSWLEMRMRRRRRSRKAFCSCCPESIVYFVFSKCIFCHSSPFCYNIEGFKKPPPGSCLCRIV